ncbi:hypothetical protein, partial [Candidatus Frankia alpina]|uniref:hypothetical protein n=1 Tax=Candidatus Frankia alpina TaxID=2699483 RepID=UPI001F3D845B
PEEPFTDLIEIPEADEAGFDSVWLEPSRSSACAGLLADNFLDTAHFPFVHADTIGAGEDTIVGPYRVTQDGDGFVIQMEQRVANPEDPKVATGAHPLVQRRWSTYVYRPPFMLRLRLEYPDAGMINTIQFCLQPEDAGSTRIYTRLLRDDLGGDAARRAAAARFEQAVLDEDLALQERFDLDGLPLIAHDDDPAEEVSIRADAAGVALRRALASLVDQAARLPAISGHSAGGRDRPPAAAPSSDEPRSASEARGETEPDPSTRRNDSRCTRTEARVSGAAHRRLKSQDVSALSGQRPWGSDQAKVGSSRDSMCPPAVTSFASFCDVSCAESCRRPGWRARTRARGAGGVNGRLPS